MNAAALTRRELRLRAIARQIIRHGYASGEVAAALARMALEYSERNIGDAARVLGLPPEDVAKLTGDAAQVITMGLAPASDKWNPGPAAWPADGNHD